MHDAILTPVAVLVNVNVTHVHNQRDQIPLFDDE